MANPVCCHCGAAQSRGTNIYMLRDGRSVCGKHFRTVTKVVLGVTFNGFMGQTLTAEAVKLLSPQQWHMNDLTRQVSLTVADVVVAVRRPDLTNDNAPNLRNCKGDIYELTTWRDVVPSDFN